MNTKALVAVIAFVAAASAMAQFKPEDTQLASLSLGHTTTGFALGNGAATKVRLGASTDSLFSTNSNAAVSTQRSAQSSSSERLSFPEPGKYAMLFAGLGVIGFIAGRRKQA